MKTQRLFTIPLALITLSTIGSAQVPSQSSLRRTSEQNRQDIEQSKCTLAIEQSPKLRGLKLGMPLQEVKSLFPLLTVRPFGVFGESSGTIRPENENKSTVDMSNVSRIEVWFVDDVLTYISVHYEDNIKWNNSQEFLEKVIEGLGISPNLKASFEDDAVYLGCESFSLVAKYNSGIIPEVYLLDRNSLLVVKKRREEKEAKERQAFKP